MDLESTFCMESGQVKTSDNQAEIFVKMLQEVVRVTLPMAQGIADEYPSVTNLVQAFRRNGETALEQVKVC